MYCTHLGRVHHIAHRWPQNEQTWSESHKTSPQNVMRSLTFNIFFGEDSLPVWLRCNHGTCGLDVALTRWRVWRRIVPSKAWIHFSRSSASRAEGQTSKNTSISNKQTDRKHTVHEMESGEWPCCGTVNVTTVTTALLSDLVFLNENR